MKKNKRVAPVAVSTNQPAQPLLGPLSKRLLIAGAAVLVVGYVVLSFADARAANWAGLVSPFFILGGYGLVGLGFYFRHR